jgi:hypothetical protein
MSSSLLLFVSLLAGAEAQPPVPPVVSSIDLAHALVFNEAKADVYFSQKLIYLDGNVERIVRVPPSVVGEDGAASWPKDQYESSKLGNGALVRYALLVCAEVNDKNHRRDVVVRCLFPESDREQLAEVQLPGRTGYLIRGRLHPHQPSRDYVTRGADQKMADIVDMIDCELVLAAEVARQLETPSVSNRTREVPPDEEDGIHWPTKAEQGRTLGTPADE